MNPVTSDDVLDLMDSHFASAALCAAMELGLFWLLRERPLDAAGVSGALGIPPARCRYWLQILVRDGLVEETPEGLRPSATARTAILDAYSQDTWAFLAQQARIRFPAVHDLALHIREPGSTWEAQGVTPPNYFDELVESPEAARRFTRMLYEIHVPLAEALAGLLDMEGVDRPPRSWISRTSVLRDARSPGNTGWRIASPITPPTSCTASCRRGSTWPWRVIPVATARRSFARCTRR
ncbi:MAG: methyltransferase family protein [Planctomycetota bacterium]